MPAVETFSFYGYTLRPAITSDFLLAERWTLADPWHRDSACPVFWLEQDQRSESYLLLDRSGPVFFFKTTRTADPHVIEIHIQFPPPVESARNNFRLMLALVLGLEWLEGTLRSSDISAIFFESRNPTLIRFCVRRLGFAHNDRWLVKPINRGADNVRGPDTNRIRVATGTD